MSGSLSLYRSDNDTSFVDILSQELNITRVLVRKPNKSIVTEKFRKIINSLQKTRWYFQDDHTMFINIFFRKLLLFLYLLLLFIHIAEKSSIPTRNFE